MSKGKVGKRRERERGERESRFDTYIGKLATGEFRKAGQEHRRDERESRNATGVREGEDSQICVGKIRGDSIGKRKHRSKQEWTNVKVRREWLRQGRGGSEEGRKAGREG